MILLGHLHPPYIPLRAVSHPARLVVHLDYSNAIFVVAIPTLSRRVSILCLYEHSLDGLVRTLQTIE
jgi:hypothetical protein